MYGYHGGYRRIDLSSGQSEWISISPDILRAYIGGVGLGTWILHQESVAGFDPLSADAPVIFAFSPLVGTPLTTSAKFAVVAKSPLTQRLNDALSSSHFAIEGKKTGADAFVLVGQCDKPSILLIENDAVRLEPAVDLWGKTTQETTSLLEQRYGPMPSAVIGPAGENLVRYATISHQNRHAGRGGLGAVLGSKRLKAILVRGSKRVSVFDPKAVVASAKLLSEKSFGPATLKYRELGTVSNLLVFNRMNALPTHNFQQGSFAHAEQISGEEWNRLHQVTRESCAACTIGCEHIYADKSGIKTRLEYESLFALGPLCGISDRDVILQAARLCDDLGLDTISTGATLAFAMECVQRGLISQPELCFGNSQILLKSIQQIATRQGIGDLLAEGTRIAAEKIGSDAPDFAPHVKGLELPGYEPRTLQTMALGFAVGSRGADHNRSGAYEIDFSSTSDRRHGTPEMAKQAVATEDRAALIDSLILCKFLRDVFADLYQESAELLQQVTGWDVTSQELQNVARRVLHLKKQFNIREGWTQSEDTLPTRFLTQGLPDGLSPGAELPKQRLKAMIMAYYQERGWTEEGLIPESLLLAYNIHKSH